MKYLKVILCLFVLSASSVTWANMPILINKDESAYGDLCIAAVTSPASVAQQAYVSAVSLKN